MRGLEICLLLAVAVTLARGSTDCRHGDSPYYSVNNLRCNQLGAERHLCYHSNVATECCRTCGSLKISGSTGGCEFGDKMRGCDQLSSQQCRMPYYNDVCCRTCSGSEVYCRNHPSVTFNGFRCDEFIRNKGAHNCYQPDVLNSCCETCRAHEIRQPTVSGCKYGDRNMKIFTDVQTGSRYQCQHLRQGYLDKCEDPRVQEDCCNTCSQYRPRSSSSSVSGGGSTSVTGGGSSSTGGGSSSSSSSHSSWSESWTSGGSSSTSGGGGTTGGCQDNPQITFDGYHCEEFLRYKGAHRCYQASVRMHCCRSCQRLAQASSSGCTHGDRKSMAFTDGETGVVFRCEQLQGQWLRKCENPNVRLDCCRTCANYKN